MRCPPPCVPPGSPRPLTLRVEMARTPTPAPVSLGVNATYRRARVESTTGRSVARMQQVVKGVASGARAVGGRVATGYGEAMRVTVVLFALLRERAGAR